MVKLSRKEEFIDATMLIVAEGGLDNFSMKKVTRKIGVSEALIYKYYPTKEILLYSCFESVHKSIARLFHGMRMPIFTTSEEIFGFIRDLWLKYFTFLVRNGYKTIFYFDYRDSVHIRQIKERDEVVRHTYFKDFSDLIHSFNESFHFTQRSDTSVLWTYILDTSGIFAKRTIRGEITDSPEYYEYIWQLMSGGIFGLLGNKS